MLSEKNKENLSKHFYTKEHNFNKKNNILDKKLQNQIICADSETYLKTLPDNCIDLVFTSPPYNFGMDYDNTNDNKDYNQYFNDLFSIFDECIRVLKHSGRFVINIQPIFSDNVPTHHIISNYFLQNKMLWLGEILWEKNHYNCNYTAWGSWKSPSKPYLKYTWEFIEIFCKGELKKEGNSENADISGDEFKKWVLAKWAVAPEHKMKKYGHPAMFPEELAYRVLRLFSFKNDIILDPFCGAGTTCLVAKKTNRNYIGIDISKKYCSIAEDRLQILL